MTYIIAILSGIAVFLVFKALITLIVPDEVKLQEKEDVDDSEIIARKLGIAVENYVFDCCILGIEPDIKRLIKLKLLGIVLAVVGIVLLLVSPVVGVASFVMGIFISIMPAKKLSEKAKEKQRELENSLPRFFDLLYTALKINMPVFAAIEQTANCMDGILSEELLASLAEVKMGVASWQNALYKLAQKYEVEEFTDFVLDITTAYEKGVPVAKLVEQKSKEIKQTSVFKAKERAAKLSSTIIFPVFGLELVPVFVILFVPILFQIINGF